MARLGLAVAGSVAVFAAALTLVFERRRFSIVAVWAFF